MHSKNSATLLLLFSILQTFLFPQQSNKSFLPFVHSNGSQIIYANNALKSLYNITNDELLKPATFHKKDFAPGYVIIKYKCSSVPRGNEILKEYNSFRNVFEYLVDMKVKQSSPLFLTLVNEMVRMNLSESELNRQNIQKRQVILSYSPKSLSAQTISSALNTGFEFSRIVLLKLDNDNLDVNEVISEINNNKSEFLARGFDIEYAEPNYLYYTESVPNDPLYSMQWAHKFTKAEAAWDIEKGSKDIIIGVIDSGVDILHEDLKANILPAKSYDFVDTDTSAYINAGFKLLSGEDYTLPDNDPTDYLGHGTHCAGIIGASGNNGLGVTGVCQNISIMALRAGFSIMNSYGQEAGLLEDAAIVNAISYAANNGARILSMSFGSSYESQTMKAAINYAESLGIIIIAAAGNDSKESKHFPAAYNNVISVAATDYYNNKACFSNYGNWVSVAAPGESIYSTVPKAGGMCTNTSGYLSLSGTSMAAPYVAGLAGLLLSKNPGLTSSEVNWIMQNSTDIPVASGFYIGTGRVNVLKALETNQVSSICDAKAEITSPSEADCFTNDIIISGTASGSSYKLYYGSGLYPTEWKELGSGGSITGGTIGTLKASEIPEGRYSIKLIVQDSKGTREARISVFVVNYSDMKTGWPQKLPSIYADFNPISDRLVVDDLDGDGKKEIIAVAGVNSSANFKWAQSVFIYNPDGTLAKSWPLPYEGFTRTNPILADLDNNGKKEILVLVNGGDFTALHGRGCVQIYNYDGSQFPGWPKRTNIPGQIAGFSVADINMDGKLDIIAATGGACCFDSSNVGAVHVFNNDGTYHKNWPISMPSNYVPKSNLVIANIDGDPAPEIIFTIVNQVNINGKLNYTYALKGDGSQAAGFPKVQEKWGIILAAGDINDDGINEVLLQDEVINNKAQVIPWNFPGMDVYSNIAVSDVNNDQKLEVLFGNGTSKAFLVDCKGNLLPGWPKQEEDFSADKQNIIADIDGDNVPEIIILWGNTLTSSLGKMPGIYAYKAIGSIVPGFPKFKGVLSIKSIAVNDVDNDGLADIVGIDSKHSIVVIGVQKKYTPARSEWPNPLHDPWQSSSALGNSVKILSDFQNISITENDSLKLLISPVYVNWSNYIVSVMSDSSKVPLSIRNGILNIKPETSWCGGTNVKLSVSNSLMSETKNFQLIVTPSIPVPIRIKSLPAVKLNEDTFSAVIIMNLYDYYRNGENQSGLNFSCEVLDKGLDSLKFDKVFSAGIASIADTVSLKVYPTKYFHGTVRLFITAADDSLIALKDTLLLKIDHVNHWPQLTSVRDTSMMEDDSIKIILNSFDIDGDKLEYSATAGVKNLKTYIRKDTLCIVPDKYWHGSSIIKVSVYDGLAADSTKFCLNVIHRNHKPSLQGIVDLVMREDDTLRTKITAEDVDNDSLIYSVTSDTNKVIVYLQKDQLTIVPDKYYWGQCFLRIKVTDSILSDSVLIKLKISHVNHAPLAFQLLLPAHNSVFTVASDPKDTLFLCWEKAQDMDQDSITYGFFSKDSLQLIKAERTQNNKLILPLAYIRKVMDESKLLRLKGTWTIIAFDGIDSTISSSTPFSLEFNVLTSSVGMEKEIPKEYILYQNYPNPFNPSTTIKFGLPKNSHVIINLFNVMGQLIAKLTEDNYAPGYYQIQFNASQLPSGIYFYSIQTQDYNKTIKMMLLK